MDLIKGKQYAVDDLELVGWRTDGRLVDDLPGYSCWTYFDGSGCYRGADKEGVEPVMRYARV